MNLSKPPVCEVWKTRSSMYCLQAQDKCMTLGEVSGWSFSRYSRNHCQAHTWVLFQLNIMEPFQPTKNSVNPHFAFWLYGVGLAETLRLWSPASSSDVWPMTDVFRDLLSTTLKRFSFLPCVTLNERVTLPALLWDLSTGRLSLFMAVFCPYFLSLVLTLLCEGCAALWGVQPSCAFVDCRLLLCWATVFKTRGHGCVWASVTGAMSVLPAGMTPSLCPGQGHAAAAAPMCWQGG